MKILKNESRTLLAKLMLQTIITFMSLFSSSSVNAQRTFSLRSPAFNIRGDASIIGNRVVAGANPANDNTATVISNIDLDGDVTTTVNSSSADLSLPVGSTVVWAGLYWGGRSSNVAARNKIKFKKNGSPYVIFTASQLDNGNTISGITAENHYQGFVNVTAYLLANGAGTYWGGDVLTITGNGAADPYGTGYYGGWSLVVIYSDNTQPYRNITVHDGYSSVWAGNGTPDVTVPISGYLTPASGGYTTKMGLVAWEGDSQILNDKLRLNVNDDAHNVTDLNNPSANYFLSKLSVAVRNPNTVQNWGVDFKYIISNISLPTNSTNTNVYFHTSGDFYLTGVIVFAIDINPVVLPVEITSFDVKCSPSKKIEINWSTASETNNDYFTIEKSKDNKEFTEVQKINGAGNSTSIINYEITDENPLPDVSYYRLKQTDYNGNFNYSGVRSIEKCDNNISLSIDDIKIENHLLQINIMSSEIIPAVIQVFDITGKLVFKKNLQLNKGLNNFTNNEFMKQGVYFIRIIDGDKISFKKIII